MLPYRLGDLRKVDCGMQVVEVDGAALAHINRVEALMSELQYPCRIDASIALLCVRGKVSFSSHLTDYTLSENQLFVTSASIIQFHESHDCELYVMVLSPNFISEMNLDKRLLTPVIMSLRRNSRHIANVPEDLIIRAKTAFYYLNEEYPQLAHTPFGSLYLRHSFCTLIYRLCSGLQIEGDGGSKSASKDRSVDYFDRLMHLLAEHYRTERSVEFYAERLQISPKHLSRVIRNYTGKSVHQWIDEFVALEIKNLLRYSTLSVQDISKELNFPNPSFMGQYFKRITGMTPGQYKRL